MTRVKVAIAMPVIVAVGMAARFGLSGEVANFIGVALWQVLVYCCVLFCQPKLTAWKTFAIALTIGWAVEAFQLTGLPVRLAEISKVFHLVLGSYFAWDDIPAYAAGAVAAGGAHHYLSKRYGA